MFKDLWVVWWSNSNRHVPKENLLIRQNTYYVLIIDIRNGAGHIIKVSVIIENRCSKGELLLVSSNVFEDCWHKESRDKFVSVDEDVSNSLVPIHG